MKSKLIHLFLLLFIGFTPTIYAQNTARGSAKSTPKTAVAPPFAINTVALKKLQTQILTALNEPNERNIAACMLSDAEIALWLTHFTTPENNNKTAQKQAFERMAATRTDATNRLQALRGTAITATISKQQAQWGDPEQRSKAILVTLALKNASQESLRFYAVDCGGKYCLVSVK